MKKERKTSKLVRTIMAFTTVFSSFGTVGVMEVKAAEEPAGRGTDWDYLYSELYFGEGKAFPVGTQIYVDVT